MSTSSEVRKSRAKGSVLDSETLSGWKLSIMPIFSYWYFFELDAWPATNAIEVCGQRIWDWRFGDAHPLDLQNAPSYISLVRFVCIENSTLTSL